MKKNAETAHQFFASDPIYEITPSFSLAKRSPVYVFLAAPVCSVYITGIVLSVTGSAGAT
ncbi:hypothetical protein LP414_25000 [Polaromonas sp. P1(28)-13]|nr:hypothetical protein LP414_25000 [Polaromonas sp. P1(28)-13]